MIAIDTNVLLRYLLEDDELQAKKANRLINGTESVLVSNVVLAESMWTLVGKKYKVGKEAIANTIQSILEDQNLLLEDELVVWRALSDYRLAQASGSRPADYADALILNIAKRAAASNNMAFNGLYTFDIAAQRLPGAKAP